MFPRAGDAADEVAHSLEIEGALHFSVNQLPYQGGLGSFLRGRALLKRLPLPFGEADGKSGFHVRI